MRESQAGRLKRTTLINKENYNIYKGVPGRDKLVESKSEDVLLIADISRVLC